ncbi:MAG TPA: hypothetical protein VGC76_00785 [Pyrinomonadaceae bacterium]|jgi:hypothetical protein
MSTVVIFGAGATKACGGPLTNEILLQAYDPKVRQEIAKSGQQKLIQREGYADILEEFLVENFHLPKDSKKRKINDYPALPLLLSLIDTAIDRKQPMNQKWVSERLIDVDRASGYFRQSLVHVREALEYIIFAVLEYKLRSLENNYYLDLLNKLYKNIDEEPVIISLNYDIIADNALVRFSENSENGRFPDYGCEIKTPAYQEPKGYFGKLLKLHGSLNWLYCPGCHRLDIGVSESGKKGTVKVLERLYQESPLEPKYSCHGSPCPDCQVFVRPILITPTHRKDYRNPHVSQVWYQAERELRQAKRAIFIGYSLPDDDVEVIYLLKRGLTRQNGSDAPEITVVEYDKDRRNLKKHPVGARYRTLFGDKIKWFNDGFESYLKSLP